MDWVIKQADLCNECHICLDVCPTYKISGDNLLSPAERLKTAVLIFEGKEIDSRQIESIYNCTKCMLCESICPEEINITKVVHKSREKLVQNDLGPLEGHKKVINGLLKKGNSVNGDPEKRLDWLPEDFPQNQSETLLYLGCIPSYITKEAATTSYLVLKKLGFNFMIIKDEGCCGTPVYEAGKTDIAKELFQKNVEKFKSLGVKNIVIPCNGCLKSFKYYYPDLLGNTGLNVLHVLEVISDLLKKNPNVLNKINRTVTFQDSCRLARGEKLIEEPRNILKSCGAEVKDMKNSKEDAFCCGAGGGIRSSFLDLSMEMAQTLLSSVETESLISTCPFCTFNLNFTSRKKNFGKTVTYFTKIILDSLN